MADFLDCLSFDNVVHVARARLLSDFPFLMGHGLTETEVRSILSTAVVLW